MPILSIILPVYNDESRIQRCLDSLSRQTLKDIEILIIDDASTDNSLSIVQKHIKNDSRFKLLHSNGEGAYVCRNLGLDYATGKYIGFIDSDDWVEENAYECLLKFFEKHPTIQSSMCASNRYVEKTETYSKHFHFDNWPEVIKMNARYLQRINGGLWNKIYLLENIKKINLKFSSYKIAADFDFNWRYYLAYPQVAILNKPLYVYTLRDNSLVTKPLGFKSLDVIRVCRDLKNFLIENKLFEEYRIPLYQIARKRLSERMLVEKTFFPIFSFMIIIWLGLDFFVFFVTGNVKTLWKRGKDSLSEQKINQLESIRKLAVGNFLVQLVNVGFYPIIARNYESEVIGEFGTLLIYSQILSLIFSGQFYMAVLVEKDESVIDEIMSLSILSTLVLSTSLLIFTVIIGKYQLVPLLILCYSLSECFKTKSYRLGRYSESNLSTFINRFSSHGLKSLSFSNSVMYLITTEIIGNLSGTINYVRSGFKFKLTDWKNKILKYRRYPLLFLPNQIFTIALQEFPTIYFAQKFSLHLAGNFFFFNRLVAQPLVLMGNIVANSLFKKLTEKDPDKRDVTIKKVILLLFAITLPVSMFMYIFGEGLFKIFLGDEFLEVGKIASMLFFIIPFKMLKGMGILTTLNSENIKTLTTLKAINLAVVFFYILNVEILSFESFLIIYFCIEMFFDGLNLYIAVQKNHF